LNIGIYLQKKRLWIQGNLGFMLIPRVQLPYKIQGVTFHIHQKFDDAWGHEGTEPCNHPTSKQLFYDVLWSIIGVYPCHFIEAAGLLNS
jgi:hypothetical protein